MHGTSTTFVQNIPDMDSKSTAAESKSPEAPTIIPSVHTHAGYARRVDQARISAEML
jgi:hypothetical protein